MKVINDLIKSDPNIDPAFKEMFGDPVGELNKTIRDAGMDAREPREEALADDRSSKMSANLKDMTIGQKWDILNHSRQLKTKTLSDCLDAIIEEHPYVYYEYFGE